MILQDTIKQKVLNPSKTLVLYLEKISTPDSPVHLLNYTVLESKTQNIIKKDSYRGTDVRWYDNSSLQLVPYIGMERKPTSDNPDDAMAGTASNKPIIVKLSDSLD
ncbi:hypothetical protein [Flavimarina sp. Hel_I_48]|uniref:hypothetical protein n=1 Tax=Flavimarina sp. Hel_I_48 TaxID=1392488 RepID=UPI0013DA381A|nr:hypothetical protein [Flavimarina sp. Hel_I_48]